MTDEQQTDSTTDAAPRLFAFYQEDKAIVDGLSKAMRMLLQRDGLTAHQVADIAMVILVLERLPYSTDGAYVDVHFTERSEEGHASWGFEVTGEYFGLQTSEYMAGPYGGDSSSRTEFETHVGGGRSPVEPWQLEDWLSVFSGHAEPDGPEAEVHVESLDALVASASSQAVPHDRWEQLESEYA